MHETKGNLGGFSMHILTAEQFTVEELEGMFQRADELRQQDEFIAGRRELKQLHLGRIMLSTFYEPSTRTRFSFEIGAEKLGIGVVTTENAAEFSSAAKGETIEDTVRVFEQYNVDAISLRTKEDGMADRAASATKVPILNGGDGKGEHPTQAVLDTYTIQKEVGSLNGLNVVMGGDLAHGRTVRSLSMMLAKYSDNRITFVSTPELKIGDDIKAYLSERGVVFEETMELYDALRGGDVIYWTRPQLERHNGDSKLAVGNDHYVLDASALEVMKPDSIIMHPLPRNLEIPTSTDSDPRARYFQQAGNGLYVRMAMLDNIMTQLP
jgi:aspartate carbamoyltransferase catalytic subunit